MKGKIISILLLLAAFLLTRCANVVAPTGGAKDITPPKVVEAKPANQSTGFDGQKIEITFDEFITLNNASQQVLVSPPLNTKPDIKQSGKTVTIKFKEDLKPNTTYTIDFGEAVKDFHEGNLFKDYRYTFSTGEILDTLNLSGKVLNADNKKPSEGLFVGLYSASRHCEKPEGFTDRKGGNRSDVATRRLTDRREVIQPDSLYSLPLKSAPDFIAKTDKEGQFHFHGLPSDRFLVFALEDMNSNLYYDLPNEKVAFLDTLVAPSDSISFTLYAFTEVDTTQMLLESKLVEEGLLRFAFRWPADDINVTTSDSLPDGFKLTEIWSKQHDTLCWYFNPGVMDTLNVTIQSPADTLINKTLRFNLHYKGAKPRNERDARALKVSNNLKNNLLLPGEDLVLHFPEPIVEIHDTLRYVQLDAFGMEYRIDTTIYDTTNYTINIADSVFYSLRGHTNKAFSLKFKRAADADFGAIIIKVCPPDAHQVVVQLLNNKGAVLEQQVVDSTTTVSFRSLLPGKYKVQAIIDTDRDGKWSTGNFHRRFQPETVIPYKDEFDVKAGWDFSLDENWQIKP